MITENSSPSEIIVWLQDLSNDGKRLPRGARQRIYDLAGINQQAVDVESGLGWCWSYREMAEMILRNATKKLIGE